MSSSNIFFAIICWLCSFVFGAIAIWAFKSKEPMHFWSGSTVSPEEITDIPSYNRANGWMWTIYTIGMIMSGILSLFNIIIGAILLVVICIPGTIVLIIAYNRIYKKYKNTSARCKIDSSTTKTPKAVVIAIIAFVGMVFVLIGIMSYYGSKDPIVNIRDNDIQIKAMYGLNIDLSEIAEISLIEKSMDDIGIGTRTNGYGGFGEALKGNFKSDIYGETLLFVQAHSSPTIKIDRINKKDIYVSFSNSEITKQLYSKLISTLPSK
ncbi:MAG: hypothetical protein H6Q59_3443 [Firmicutes bacterium]|nr:hypothetical protein [Bacillota bacterium]